MFNTVVAVMTKSLHDGNELESELTRCAQDILKFMQSHYHWPEMKSKHHNHPVSASSIAYLQIRSLQSTVHVLLPRI